MYSERDRERYTKKLIKLGITDEVEVDAVLQYLYTAATIAIRELKQHQSEEEKTITVWQNRRWWEKNLCNMD